jgi:hypothetical protein
MRIYHGKEHLVRRDGSIEIEGPWAGVQPAALGLAAALTLLLLLHVWVLLVPGLVLAVYLLVLPTRRRVIFDVPRRCLRIEHAGPWRERNAKPIPFADVEAIRFLRGKRKGGKNLLRVVARTTWGDAYLMSLYEGTDERALASGIQNALGQ